MYFAIRQYEFSKDDTTHPEKICGPVSVLTTLLNSLSKEVKGWRSQGIDPDIIADEELLITILQDAIDRAKRELLL